jgi:hypothetical protein
LRDLEAERPSTESLTRQATRIAAIAMTVGVPAVGTATVLAIAPPALTFFSTKVITVAGAVALVAGTITYFISNGSSEPRRVLVAASDTQTALTPQTPAQTPSAPQPSPDAAAPPVTVQESAPAAAGGTEPRVDPHAALDLTVTLEFETVHVAGILAEVEGLTGVPILVDRRAVGLPAVPFLITTDAAPSAPYPISGMLAEVHIRNQRLDAVLDLLARELGLRAVWEPGYVWISTQNNIFQDMTPATPARYAIYAEKDRERRASIVQSIEFENVHISEVLEFLNEVYEVNFVLDSRVVAPPSKTPAMMASVPSGKVTDGVVSYINLRNVQMPELLTVLSRLTNTTSFVLRDYVWFTTRGRASSDGLTQVKPNPALAKTLASQVSVAFEDVRMEEIFDFLRDIYGINLFVDPRITAWEEEPGDAVPFRGASASAHSGNLSHGLIHSLYCRELSVRSVLDIVTQSLKLTHTVQGDAIVISSRDASRSGTPDAADFIPSSKFAEAGTEAVKAYRKSLQVMQSRPVACAEITLLRIESADEVRAEIDVCGTPKWYKVGDSFAPYRVYRIDPVKQQVLLYNDDTDRTQPFFVAH